MSNLNTEAYLRAKGVIDSEPIDHDHPCPTCGYNLRGLKYGHKCPECGALIERRHRRLEHFMDAPIKYMKQIRLGMLLIAAGLILLVGCTVITPITSKNSVSFLFMIFISGCSTFVSGIWIITNKRPDAPVVESHRWSPRKILRILAIAASVLMALEWIITMYWWPPPFVVDRGLFLVAGTTLLATCAMVAWLLSDYAAWIHDNKLSHNFETIIILFSFLWIFGMVALFTFSVPFAFELWILILLGTFIWYFISIMSLLDLMGRAIRDKPTHDASILRDPEKILR